MRATMRLLVPFTMAGAILVSSAAALDRAPDRLSIAYDIERKGNVVGQHSISFSETGDGLSRIEIGARIRVKFGFITAFRLDHEAVELWDGSRLTSLVSTTRRNREEARVEVRPRDDSFEVASDETVTIAPSDLVPSSFTKPDFWIEHGERDFTLLDTLSGLMRPSVLLCGDWQQLTLDDRSFDVTYYSIRDLETDRLSHEFWIDDEGFLVKGILHTKDGETLVYRLAEA